MEQRTIFQAWWRFFLVTLVVGGPIYVGLCWLVGLALRVLGMAEKQSLVPTLLVGLSGLAVVSYMTFTWSIRRMLSSNADAPKDALSDASGT